MARALSGPVRATHVVLAAPENLDVQRQPMPAPGRALWTSGIDPLVTENLLADHNDIDLSLCHHHAIAAHEAAHPGTSP